VEQQLAQQLSEVPFGDLLTSMGRGLAEAQFALDRMSGLVALTLSGNYGLETDASGEWSVVERNSRVAFVHPRATGSVLTEIVEPAEGVH